MPTKKKVILKDVIIIKLKEDKFKIEKIPKYQPELQERLLFLSKKGIGGRERTREIVRYRDEYTCQTCNEIRTPEMAKEQGKRQLDVHHLNGLCGKMSRKYDKIESLSQMITLCHKCHFNHPEHTLKTNKKSY
jgi:hypothetical protein